LSKVSRLNQFIDIKGIIIAEPVVILRSAFCICSSLEAELARNWNYLKSSCVGYERIDFYAIVASRLE
jgi:hypothetical protein